MLAQVYYCDQYTEMIDYRLHSQTYGYNDTVAAFIDSAYIARWQMSQVVRPSKSLCYQFLGRRTWVVCLINVVR